MLWVIDEIYANALTAVGDLVTALRLLAGDPMVRLPRLLLGAYIKHYERMER